MAAPERHIEAVGDQALEEALGARAEPVRDVAYGEGRLFSPGAGAARLEVFPQTGVTRLTARDLRVELFGTATATATEGGVKFHRTEERQQARLHVTADGAVEFTLTAGGTLSPSTGRATAAQPTPMAQQPVAGPENVPEPRSGTAETTHQLPAPVGETAPMPLPAQAPARPTTETAQRRPAPPETEQPRLALTGRLGRTPSFRTTKTGTLVGRFPLAVHQEDGTTRWHTVLAFGSRAEQLQRRAETGELAQGREVDVVGYLHTNQRIGKDGQPRPVQEVYAVAVKNR